MSGPVSAMVIARYVCERSNWTTTVPQLHATLFFGQLYCLGETGKPLIADTFIAAARGPVIARLDDRFSIYGDGRVPNIFLSTEAFKDKRKRGWLNDISRDLHGLDVAKLQRFIRPPGGAWSKAYRPESPGSILTEDAFKAEYKARLATS